MLRRMRDGYVEVWQPGHPLARRDGYVFEHRMVAFDAGLDVRRSDHVHHVNHDTVDNRAENLKVLDVVAHALAHANEGWIFNQYGVWETGTGFRRRHAEWEAALGDRQCEICGRDINGRRLDAVVCGNNCRVKRWKRLHRRSN